MSYAVENHATGGNHIRLAPGTLINNTYEVVGEAGSGNFARVFECRDVRSGARLAVKLMKEGYERDADFEQEILSVVNKNDPSDTSGIVRLQEKIRWGKYVGLVFTLKGKALRNCRTPMNRADLTQVAKDIATSLHFLHFKCRAVHTDLKPENILAEIDPSKPQKWVLCDFGSASFYSAVMDNDLITTRPYRAPEVVMKRGWNFNADAWSLGCILYELSVGRKLFDAQSDAEHLEVMQARLGPIPASLHPPRTLSSGRRGVRTLTEELAHEPELLAVIQQLLQYDPNTRPKCGDILSMPYFGGASSTPNSASSSRSSSAAVAADRHAIVPGAAYPSAAAPTGHHYKSSLTSSAAGAAAAISSGIENRGIYATNTGVVRRDQMPTTATTASTRTSIGLGHPHQQVRPTLQSMSHASANVPHHHGPGVSKASFGAQPLSSSAFRVQNTAGSGSAPMTRGSLPHPSHLPRPTELGLAHHHHPHHQATTTTTATSGSSTRGIMSPAMPHYVR